MRRLALAVLTLLLASAVFTSPVVAQAGSYLPLNTGLRWDYDNGQGSTMLSSVDGTRIILGRETTIILHQLTGPAAQVLQNYWSVDAEMNLYLHGAENFTGGFIAVYDPPILWLDAPLALDKTWASSTKVYFDYEGTYPGDPMDLTMAVGEEVDLVVPAGTFASFGVGNVLPMATFATGSGERYDVLGLRCDSCGDSKVTVEYTGWYSQGIGQIRDIFPSYGAFDLVSWNGPVIVLTSSWGQFKDLYR